MSCHARCAQNPPFSSHHRVHSNLAQQFLFFSLLIKSPAAREVDQSSGEKGRERACACVRCGGGGEAIEPTHDIGRRTPQIFGLLVRPPSAFPDVPNGILRLPSPAPHCPQILSSGQHAREHSRIRKPVFASDEVRRYCQCVWDVGVFAAEVNSSSSFYLALPSTVEIKSQKFKLTLPSLSSCRRLSRVAQIGSCQVLRSSCGSCILCREQKAKT